MTQTVGLTEAREALRGVTVTTVTPFLQNSLDVDFEGMRRNLEFLAGSGVSAIVPAGNTGEFHSLTTEESELVTRATIEAVGDRKAVFAGVGGDLRTAQRLARSAQEAGAAGILIHEPSHTFVSGDGLGEYYRRLSGAVDIGVAIYKRTPRLPDSLLVELAGQCGNVVGIKYAWNDVAAYVDLVGKVPGETVCACGSAERWALPYSAAGTTGFTSGIANIVPDSTVRFWSDLQSNPRGAETFAAWQRFARIEDLRARDAAAWNVPVIKCAMDLAGLVGGPVRPPLSVLPPPDRARLASLVADLSDGRA